MQMLGEDLVTVLDFLHIKYVIGLGEGAGANILLRFGMAHASRCLGLILVNVTAGKTSVMDYFKDKVRIWGSTIILKEAGTSTWKINVSAVFELETWICGPQPEHWAVSCFPQVWPRKLAKSSPTSQHYRFHYFQVGTIALPFITSKKAHEMSVLQFCLNCKRISS